MFKFLQVSLVCLCIASVAKGEILQDNISSVSSKSNENTSDVEKWFPHIFDFLELLDLQQLLKIVMEYSNDPEVLKFVGFVTSPEFPELVHEFESMDEFKEAFAFLESKGYNVKLLLEIINSLLNVPPFETNKIWRAKKGITGLLEDVMATIPVDDMKKLFESKIETSPEVAELFETINSEEFVNILKKMSQNPKFKEFKKTFESYGFEFEIICAGAKEIFGEYYQGIFCE